ncbi:MmcB family DNA repair protein [Chthonobacter rhizosphaerae]|uniref:MmcB family DNA repair protein n=1 Tax=Chthonobacter rhizosphaerae TaxID=2735553 RepID=UPI0015EFBAB1|nr:MmcB family DNA repair protein [Chthonobacter rhizosphaerae]
MADQSARLIEALVVDGRQSERARLVQRGVGRMMIGLGFSIVTELPLASGRRADVVGLAPNGDLWIVEIKSSVEDFRADRKWPDYRRHCDRLFFATHEAVPLDIFPEDAGLILADGFGAAVLRDAPEHRLAPATRKATLLRFAHVAARRFHTLLDPGVQEMGGF